MCVKHQDLQMFGLKINMSKENMSKKNIIFTRLKSWIAVASRNFKWANFKLLKLVV